MIYIIDGFKKALTIIFSLDREFLNIIMVSVSISFTSTILSVFLAIPFGIWLATARFRGRQIIVTILNTLMSVPTVVIGLFLYSVLSRQGPLGSLGILFTPAAMIVGQCILAFPIIAATVTGGVSNLGNRPYIAARLLGASPMRSTFLFLREAKLIVITSALAGFGRVFSEIGISMMLGGNIRFYTRNITSTIALETSRGEFGLGIALGIVLLIVAFLINAIVYSFRRA
ncbi:ABC transporter permease [candidate division KSB1 bacterium]|nr:ABC transporter permease [candidate division KSB1 bacterium]